MHAIQRITLLLLLVFPLLVVAGEFGDHCATSLAAGLTVKTDCSQNTVYEGKTYCFGNAQAKQAFDGAANKADIVAKAAAFYAKGAETPREKISQDEALRRIKSTACDLSDKDLGYLELDGMDLHHCNMVNSSFFGAYLRGANLSGAKMQRS